VSTVVGRSSSIRQLFFNVILAGIAGWLGYSYAGSPRWIHASAFAVVAGTGAILTTLFNRVDSQLEAILNNSVNADAAQRMKGVSRYIASVQSELTVFLVLAAVGWLSTLAMSGALFFVGSLSRRQYSAIMAIGYAGVTTTVAYAWRVLRLHLQLHEFRTDLFDRLAEEKRTVATLRQLNPSILTPLTRSSGEVRNHPGL
jgi:hypothetical protein